MTATYHRGVHRFAVFVVCWTIFLFIAGALVTSQDAALSVPDWPSTFGTLLPSWMQLNGGAFFEHSHRVIAGVMGVLTLILAIAIWVKEERVWLRWFAAIAVGGVVVQAILGGAAVLSIAVFTSRWWVSERPQLRDSGSPSMRTVATVNAEMIFLQVILGAGFRHQYLPIWPNMAGALVGLGVVIWTA